MRTCVECKHEPALRDANLGRECMTAYLRQTRNARPIVSPWARRAADHELPAKVLA